MAGESFKTPGNATAAFRACDGRLLRFVILHHTGYGQVHWDWFFEECERLAAWRVYHDPTRPSKDPLELFKGDMHRKLYLEHEGPVCGGRGEVRRVASGTYDLLEKNSQCWRGILRGVPLSGPFELRHVAGDRWVLAGAIWAGLEAARGS